MTANQLWYKVLNERTILVIQDTAQKRQQYEEQIIRTFYVSHADPQEIYNTDQPDVRIQGIAIQPVVSVNKTANTITVRGTPNIVNILEKVIQANDRPRAEIVIDVEMLEVNRQRAKELGLNLSQYQIGAIFSPEGRAGRRRHDPAPATATGARRASAARTFNLNTISQGISTADFYLTVPQAVVKFLASDTRTRVLAKPQLRGAEGADLELNLGDEIPVPSDRLRRPRRRRRQHRADPSFTYQNVGVNVKMKPRVTFENEIVLEIEVENSTLGANINVAGQSLPTFGTRKVKTRMRLREGESNLLAGLVREEDRKVLRGVPGPDADPDPQGHPRRHRGADPVDRHRDPADAAHRADARADAGAPQSDLHRLADEPRPDRTDAGDRRRAAAGGSGTGRGHAAWRRAAGRAAGQRVADAGRRDVDAAAGAGRRPRRPPPPQPTADAAAVAATCRRRSRRLPPTAPAAAPSAARHAAPAQPPRAPRPRSASRRRGRSSASAAGPYTVPIAISNASRLSLMSVSLTYNPALVRVRSVQEGPFFQQGGVDAVVQPAGRRQRRPRRHLGDARRPIRPAPRAPACSRRWSSTPWRRAPRPSR